MQLHREQHDMHTASLQDSKKRLEVLLSLTKTPLADLRNVQNKSHASKTLCEVRIWHTSKLMCHRCAVYPCWCANTGLLPWLVPCLWKTAVQDARLMLSRGAWLGLGGFSKMLPVQVDEIMALQPEPGNVTRHMWVLSEQRSSKVHSWPDLQRVIAAEYTAKVSCQVRVGFGPVDIIN